MSTRTLGLRAEALLDHRLEDNDLLAAYVRLCWYMELNETGPAVNVGVMVLRQVTAFARADKALAVCRQLADVGLIKLEAAPASAGENVWTLTVAAE